MTCIANHAFRTPSSIEKSIPEFRQTIKHRGTLTSHEFLETKLEVHSI